MDILTQRQKKILYGIIHEYVKLKKPVSSKKILEITNLDCSSATIRNDMKFLEDEGYINQPHTSAGRMPTDKGLRFYVECLENLSDYDSTKETEILISKELHFGSVEDILSNLTIYLSHWMKGFAIIERPFFEKLVINKITISRVFLNYWVVVLITNMGIAESFFLYFNEDLPVNKLEVFLTEKLRGLKLEEVKDFLDKAEFPEYSWYNSNFEYLLGFLEKMVNQSIQKRYHKHGFENIIQDITIPPESIKLFLEFTENEDLLKQLFAELQAGARTSVNIGKELGRIGLSDFSLFYKGYFAGENPLGRIAVFTSKTTDYLENLKGLQFASNRLSEYMTRITNLMPM